MQWAVIGLICTTGFASSASAAIAQLSWIQTTEDTDGDPVTVTENRILWQCGSESGYPHDLTVPATTEHAVPVPDDVCTFAVTAIDDSGIESAPSDPVTVDYTVAVADPIAGPEITWRVAEPMAFPVVAAESAGNITSNGLNHTVTLAGGESAGDLIVIEGGVRDGDVVAPPAGEGWTEIVNGDALDNNANGGAWYKTAGASESNPTFTSSSAGKGAWKAYRITGWDTGTPPDGATAFGSSTDGDPPSHTASRTDDILWLTFDLHIGDDAAATAYPYGAGNEGTAAPGGGAGPVSLHWDRKTANAGSENPSAFTGLTNQHWRTGTIAVYPSAGGGGATVVGQGTETETALAATSAKQRGVGQAVETQAALAATAAKLAAVAQALETDAALGITPLKTAAAGLATESDAGFAAPAEKAYSAGQALETAVAQAVGAGKAAAVGLATELDSAFAAATGAGVVVGQAIEEADTALSPAAAKAYAVQIALETNEPLAVTARKAVAVQIAEEVASALGITVTKDYLVGLATEVDSGLSATAIVGELVERVARTGARSATLTASGKNESAVSHAASKATLVSTGNNTVN